MKDMYGIYYDKVDVDFKLNEKNAEIADLKKRMFNASAYLEAIAVWLDSCPAEPYKDIKQMANISAVEVRKAAMDLIKHKE